MQALGDCLQLVLSKLPLADRTRLSRTCKSLHAACFRTTCCAKLSQHDLEAKEDLQLPLVHSLWLYEVDCSSELAAYLISACCSPLQQLQELRISHPSSTDGLQQLLSACTSLTSLIIEGDCSCSLPATPGCWDQRPLQLQQLALLRNSQVSPCQLLSWLSTAAADSASTQHASELKQALLQDTLDAMAAFAPEGCGTGNDNSIMCQLLPAWPQLTALDLSGCSSVGGSFSSFIALCPLLKQLQLHSCYKVTNNTLQALSTSLDNNSSNSHCSSSSSSSALGTTFFDLNSNNSSSSSSGSSLASQNNGKPATAAEGGALTSRSLPLCHLNLAYTRVSDGGMRHLAAALPALQHLNLKGCNVGDDGLLPLLQLQQLTGLNIKHCHRVTEDGIQQLSRLGQLRSLAYGFTSMPEADDVATAIAQQFKGLTALDLLMSELTNQGLAALGQGLSQLVHLKLYQASVTDGALRMFAEQPGGKHLQGLVLYGLGGLRDLQCLEAFSSIKQLQLGSLCDLADMPAALQQLSALSQLQHLTLERMDGLSVHCLRQVLTGCKGMHVMRVRGCDGVSADDMAEELAAQAAAKCNSSASIWWAASPSCDTDDEEDGWQLMPA